MLQLVDYLEALLDRLFVLFLLVAREGPLVLLERHEGVDQGRPGLGEGEEARHLVPLGRLSVVVEVLEAARNPLAELDLLLGRLQPLELLLQDATAVSRSPLLARSKTSDTLTIAPSTKPPVNRGMLYNC